MIAHNVIAHTPTLVFTHTVRACRNAIEFNSVSIQRIIPGGYNHMKVHVILAVPPEYVHTLDIPQVATVFPYGQVTFEIRSGGMIAPSGRVIETLGDRNDDMVIVCAAVQVGYWRQSKNNIINNHVETRKGATHFGLA